MGVPCTEVVVVGDVNPDLVLRGDVVPRFGQAEQLLDAADLTLAGSGAIVACGLARLGHTVRLVAAVGVDRLGDLCVELLEQRGVRVDALVRRRETSTGLTVVLSHGDRAILTYPGAIATLTSGDVEPWLSGTRHVHSASCYLTPALHPDLPGVLSRARARGATVSVDTNDDPHREWTLLPELLGATDVVLPNADEVRRWSAALDPTRSQEQPWRAAAAHVLELVPTVVVKTGAEGGHCRTAAGDTHAAAPPRTRPVDTTGAGDSFDAGWISARLRGLPHPEALLWAVRAGALSTQAAGGTAGQATQAQLQEPAAPAP